MSACSRQKYRNPAYPSRLQILKKPALLEKHQPMAWRLNPRLAGAVALFLAVNGRVKAEDAPQAPKPNIKSGEVVALVAPIFKHGEGRGAVGCDAVAPPVFLSEEDALQVISEELSQTGIKLSQQKVAWQDVKLIPFKTDKKKEAKEEVVYVAATDVKANQKSEPLVLTGFDPEHKVAVKYVSRLDHDRLFTEKNGLVYRVDLPATARFVDQAVREQKKEKVSFAAFYEPMSGLRGEAATKAAESEKDPKKLEAKVHELEKAEAQRLLRLQVKDFVDWLKAQGAI